MYVDALVRFEQLENGVLDIETGVRREGLGNAQEGVGKDFDAELLLTSDRVLVLHQVVVSCDLEGAATGHDSLVLEEIAHGAETILDGVLDLMKSVIVGTTHEDGNGLRIGALLDESVLVLAENALVDVAGLAKIGLIEIVERVDGVTTASQCEALHVAALGTALFYVKSTTMQNFVIF